MVRELCEMYNRQIWWDKFIKFLKSETVLAAAVMAAIISAFFVPPSFAYLEYIDYKVLLCLFCLMIVVSGLKKIHAFELAASFVVQKSRNLRQLSLGIILLTYFLAMFMTNDVALITLVPFTLIVLNKIDEDEYAILVIVLQTIAANIGSSLTPIGNPQNLYIFTRYGIPLGEFLLILLPVVLLGGILLCFSVLFIEKKGITSNIDKESTGIDKKGLIFYSLLFILSVLAVFKIIPIVIASLILSLCVFIIDRRLFREVDYSLLITFVGFFIFVGNLSEMENVRYFLSELLSQGKFLISILTSQIISNVPAAVLLSGFTDDYRELLLGVNVGGLGTLVASMASVISYKFYVKAHPVLSKKYLKVFTLYNVVFLAILSVAVLLLY
jgi:Na+/H+ antiporter NhaD/arsenite permease-like protein